MRRRAMSSEDARLRRERGHNDAREFAQKIGGSVPAYDTIGKRDVYLNEYNFSVKSGEKKWQIFLYGINRLRTDPIFSGIDGLGKIMIRCVESFPDNRDEYLSDKAKYKNELKKNMIKLAKKLKNKKILRAFLSKSFFNDNEVQFLVVKDDGLFNIFYNEDVIKVLTNAYTIETSKARRAGEFDAQKVLFKCGNLTHGEIEIRTDSKVHYKELKFWLYKIKTLELLKSRINPSESDERRNLILFGKAITKLKKPLGLT